jgi:hypothetical protein
MPNILDASIRKFAVFAMVLGMMIMFGTTVSAQDDDPATPVVTETTESAEVADLPETGTGSDSNSGTYVPILIMGGAVLAGAASLFVARNKASHKA